MPHEFYKMKTEDNELYKSLGEASIVFFKGDLNYRKLMGEMNWPPTTSFEDALRGTFVNFIYLMFYNNMNILLMNIFRIFSFSVGGR